jgi:hypothetical protein
MTATSTLTSPEPVPGRDCDPALLPFLAAPDEQTARNHLGELLERDASPLAFQVIRGHLRGPKDDVEDVHAGVLLRLAAHLRTLRTRDAEEPAIRDFASYVAVVAHSAATRRCASVAAARAPAHAHALRAHAGPSPGAVKAGGNCCAARRSSAAAPGTRGRRRCWPR